MKQINWDSVQPKIVTPAILRTADENTFPPTYSGTSWLAAARILKALGDDLEAIRSLDPWNLDKRASRAIRGLNLTGFMAGWACSVLRQMHNASPGKSGAVIEIGKGVVDQTPIEESAVGELEKALGPPDPERGD